MPYCLKCGTKVEENMVFCPICGTQLKDAPIKEAVPEQKQEEQKKPAKTAKEAKTSDQSFVTYLVSGLILLIIGAFAILQLSNPRMNLAQNLTIMLSVIGVIIIVGAVYVAISGHHLRVTNLNQR
jgi:uncharacterized membrane protein YvbJ